MIIFTVLIYFQKMPAQKFLTLPGGLKMPTVGLGTFLAKNEEELVNALDVALEKGYRHIDTAWVYENEKIIGNVLKKWFSSGKLKREDLFITTKLPIVGVHPDRVELFMKKSLENLQLDYVDLYLVHFPVGGKYKEGLVRPPYNENGEAELEPKTDHAAVWKKMEEQVDAGRTKTIGLSNYNIKQIETVLKTARIKPVNLQVELHVYLQQRSLVDFCHRNGISVVAYCPLGNPGMKNFFKNMGKEELIVKLPDILSDPVIDKIAQKHSKTPAQIALRFLLQRNIVVIPKSVTPQRIEQNFDLFSFNLNDDEMKDLYALDMGEDGRLVNFKLYKGVENHPDYPLERK